MLKQMLKQNGSNAEANFNQSQRQTLAGRLLVLGLPVETPIHVVAYVTREAASAWMGKKP